MSTALGPNNRRSEQLAQIAGALRYIVSLLVAIVGVIAAIVVIPDHNALVRWLYVVLGVAIVALAAIGVISVAQLTGQKRAERQRQRQSLERLERLARGVRLPEEQGDRFTGRVRVLREIVAWLGDRSPASALWAIVGDPGSGKSAVLGRLVVAAEPRRRAVLDTRAAPAGTLPEKGAIDLFVDARDQSVGAIARAVGDRAGVRADTPEQDIDALVSERRKPLVVVLDSLDEAGEAAASIARWLAQLADRGRAVGIRVLVATRPGGPSRELVRELGGNARVCDLDSGEFFEFDDLVGAVEARLVGDPGAPAAYRADRRLARTVAVAVVERARPWCPTGALADPR